MAIILSTCTGHNFEFVQSKGIQSCLPDTPHPSITNLHRDWSAPATSLTVVLLLFIFFCQLVNAIPAMPC